MRKTLLFAWLVLLSGLLPAAAVPVDASARTRVATTSARSTLDRPSGLVSSTVDVAITNTGDRALESPLHAAVFFTSEAGTLTGLQVIGASSGLGQPPYQTFFYDLSGSVGAGLAPQATTTFTLRFTPPKGTRVTFRVVPFAVVNGDPVASAGGPYAGQRDQEIAFNGAGSSDPDNDPITFAWDFGDGSPAATAVAPRHRYSAPGTYEALFTVRDNRGGVATTRVPVAISPAQPFALGRVRTLDGAGLPLGGVDVAESLSGNVVALKSQRSSGFAALGRGPGSYVWKFSKPDYLDVWRKATLATGNVAIVANPWLSKRNANATRISPIASARLTSSSVSLDFAAGAFPQPSDATLTELTPLTMPYPLPAGWSPLGQFDLALSTEPSQPGTATLQLRGPLLAAEGAILAKFNPVMVKWEAVAAVAVGGANSATAQIASSGAFALVVRDGGTTAPPVAEVGQPLEETTAPTDTTGVTATGTVTPAVSAASRDAALVTATARVTFDNSTPLPSGTVFATAVSEKYELAAGGITRTPDYDTTIFAYQRPGNLLAAEFPMRPQLLFGPEELKEATVHVDVLNARAFAGGVIDNGGGQLGKDGVHVTIPPDAITGVQPAEIAARDPQSFVGLTGGVLPVKAFTLNLGALTGGKLLGLAVDALEPNANFVLGIVVSDANSRGITPLERFVTDAAGRLTSAEPSTGPRLPGASGSGDYVLIKVASPLALIEGIARDAAGNPTAGLAVRASGQPWLVFSAEDGSYKTLAGTGTTLVTVVDPRDRNEGSANVVIDDPAQLKHVDLSTGPTPPRVAAVDPAANARGVRRVTPIKVTFSETINSASFAATGVVLRDQSNAAVPASLTLNRANTVATLLPANPLAAGASFHIEVSAAITDFSGLPIAGPLTFEFTTAPPDERPAGAELVIYEPGAANVPASTLSQLVGYAPGAGSSQVIAQGSAGTADPNVTVILVNETTGETATVISKADGSFANFINASEDDFISATFLNANGTRISVPATRQLFDGGQVGLYRQGGILEAQSDGGPVQVLVEPEAISRRSKFKLEAGALGEVLAFLQGAVPENATIIGGLKFSAEGDVLKQSADIVFPIAAENLALAPGTPPEQGQFVLTRVTEVDGVKVNEVVDSMHYADGALRTASPPFLGLVGTGLLAISTFPTASAIVTGRVVVAPEGTTAAQLEQVVHVAADGTTSLGANPIFNFPPVPGASVGFTNDQTINSGSFTLRPGAFMARTNSVGFYVLKVPVVNDNPIAVFAQSILFPGRKPGGPAVQDAGVPRAGQSEIRVKNLAFVTPAANTNDKTPPLVTLQQPFAVLSVNFPQFLTVHMFDNASTPTVLSLDWVRATPGSTGPFSFALADGTPLATSDVTFAAGSPTTTGLNSADVSINVNVTKSAILIVRATAVDQAGNQRTRDFSVRFSPTLPVPNDPLQPSDPNDAIPPRVTSIRPGPEEVVSSFSEIVLTFSEAVSQDIETNPGAIGVFGSISNGVPVKVELAADHLSAIVRPIGLREGDDVNVGVTPIVRDLKGNPIQPFSSNFRIAGAAPYALTNSSGVAATTVAGQFAYSLLRDGEPNQHRLAIHKLGDISQVAPIGTLSLPPFPRALAYVPKFAFKKKVGAPLEEKTLLVVAGGLLGEDQVGQWLWVIDVSDPAAPTRIASQLAVPDFAAAVTILKYSNGRIFAGVNTPEFAVIYRIALQTFITASNLTPQEFAALPVDGEDGVEFNDDGDFVDEGEKLPVPAKRTLFGLEFSFPLAFQRFLNDFDALGGGGFLAATFANRGSLAPARLQVVTFGGQIIGTGGDPSGAAEIGGGNATRVLLEQDFEIQSQAGPGSISLAALVAAGSKVLVYDISSNPVTPTAVRSIELPSGSGNVLSLVRDGTGRFLAGTTSKLFVLDRKLMGLPQLPPGQASPAVVAVFDAQSVGRSVGVNEAFIVGLSGGNLSVQPRAPQISVVRFPSTPVLDTSTIAGLPNAEEFAEDLIASVVEEKFLTPSPLRAFGAAFPSALANPPPPQFHYYALVRVSGALGPELKLAIESTDRHGRRLPPRGNVSPAVILTDHAGAANVANAQPTVTAQKAHRLSHDPNSPFYNIYLSQPLLLARDPVSPTVLGGIAAVPGRQAVQMGERLRVSLEDAATTGAFGSLFTFTPSIEQPPSGLSQSVDSFCADFVDSLNPSMRSASPRVDGVSMQSGEFSHRATDFIAEGRGLDLVVSRSYESQTHYRGAFGRGWDSPLFRRLCELPSGLVPAEVRLPLTFYGVAAKDQIAGPGDVMVQDGAGDLRLYRRISALNGNLALLPAFQNDPAMTEFGWSGKVAVFYAPPAGEFDMLVRFTDGSYVSIDPQAARHYYDAEGRVTRIVSAYDEAQFKFEYRADGKLHRVIGDNGTNLEFGYFGRTTAPDFVQSLDKPFPDEARLGLIARIKAGAANIEYTYDANASLTKVQALSTTPQIYGYDTAAPFLLTVIGQQDGTVGPSQKITYVNGLVTQIETDGVTRTFAGAQATAEARQLAGNANVSVTSSGGAAQFGVDTSGLPTSFAGKTVATSPDGQIKTFGSGNEALENVYDTANPIFRFRGNLLGVKGQGGQISATLAYDNTTWNRLTSRTSPEAVTTNYSYSGGAGHNAATSVTLTTGSNVRKITLNDWGQVTKEQLSESGITFTKDTLFTANLPSGLKEGAVQTVSMTRDPQGRLASAAHATAQQMPSIDATGQITGITSSAGGPSLTAGYNTDTGNLISMTVAGGTSSLSESLTPDSADPGRLSGFSLTQTGVPAESGTISYNTLGQITGYTGSETVSVGYTGALPTSYDAPGEHYSIVHGPGGRVTSFTENGIATTIGYDGQGRVRTVTGAGATRTLGYNSGRQISTETITGAGATLATRNLSYDSSGRLSQVTGGDVTKTLEYFPDGTIRAVKTGGFDVSRYTRDGGGFLIGADFFGGAVSVTMANLEPINGLPKTQTTRYIGGGSVTAAMTYDNFGRPLTQSIGGLAASSFTYDSFGNRTSATDPDGVTLNEAFSPMGLPLLRTFPDGSSVTNTYDAAWNLMSSGSVGYSYNPEGLISSVTFPDRTSASFTNLNSFLQARAVTYGSLSQTHSYVDARRTGIAAAGDSLGVTYDGLGRTTSLTLNGHVLTYGYSPDLGLKSEESPLGRWEIAFNPNGHIATEKYPSGVSSSLSPGVAGLMTQHSAAGATAIGWADLDVLRSVTYAGGVVMTRHFDSAMRPFKITWDKGGTLVAGIEWNLTDAGRVLSEARLHSGLFDVYHRNAPGAAMRIIGASFGATSNTGAGAAQTILGLGYTGGELDLAGASSSGTGARATLPLPGDTLTRDSRGVVTAGPVWVQRDAGLTRVQAQFDYDGFLQLRTIRLLDSNGTPQVTVTYQRDGAGRIVRRTVVGPPTVCVPGDFRYAWRDEQLIEEYAVVSGVNRLAARYFWAGEDLIRIERAATPGGSMTGFIPLAALNGSIQGYLDDAGTLLEEVRYGLYGLPEISGPGGIAARSGVDGRLLFHGAFFEPEAGIYDMGKRTLHSVFGRFLQRDPDYFVHSMAFYSAFDGDPASNVDREGTAPSRVMGTRAAGSWEGVVHGIMKGGVVEDKGITAFGLNARFKKNSKLVDFTSKTLAFASEFLPENSKAQNALSGAASVTKVAKYGLDIVETIYGLKDAASKLKTAERNLEVAHVIFSGERMLFANKDLHDTGVTLPDVIKSYKEFGRAGVKVKEERLQLHKARIAASKLRLGIAGAVFKKSLERAGEKESELYTAGNAAFNVGVGVLDLIDLNTRREIGLLTGKSEISLGGGYFSGNAGQLGMRGLFALKAADISFQIGFEGASQIGIPLYLRYAVSPEVAADYRAAVKQFTNDGGFGLKLLGGTLNSFGLISDNASFQLLQLGDFSITGYIADQVDAAAHRREAYLNGVSAP